VAQLAHLAGLCFVIFALISVVRSLERGDLFSGLMKAVIYGVIGTILARL
jgi:hypothetical protein